MGRRRGIVLALVVLSLVAGPVAGATDAAAAGGVAHGGAASTTAPTGAPAVAPGPATQTTPTIQLEQELRLTPDRPGEYRVHHRYRVPDAVVSLTVELPPRATVTGRSGFTRRDGTTYAWDGRTAAPTLTYDVPANRTVDRDDPIAAPGQYTFVDVGEWALVAGPELSHRWSSRGGVELERSRTVAGEGATGDTMAFLGPHREYRRTAHGQTIRLVVPEAATLAERPEAILDSIAAASDALRVGDRDREVFVVAAPTGGVEWGVRGIKTGGADAWVRDVERLDDVDNVWLHEYVHTRQGYDAADSARWFTEASAVYYAALLTLEQERIGFDAFERRLARGASREYAGTRLAEPGTWGGNPDYFVGPLVAGALDRQLRLSTGSERSLQDVLRRVNERDGPVDADALEGYLRAGGGDEVVELGRRYARTTDRPEMWDVAAHGEAFGPLPPRFTTDLADSPEALRIEGPYREAAADPVRPVVVVTGETLAVDVRVENAGGTAGEYDVPLRVDGVEQDRQHGRLSPGDATTLSFSHEFAAVGTYEVEAGEVSLPVRVRQPARASVTGFRADAPTVTAGSTVTLAVTVANDADLPGRLDVPVHENGRPVDTEVVRLGPGETRTVFVERTLDEPGEYVYELGDASADRVVVTVARTATPTRTADGPPESPLPGFGFGVAAVAVVAFAVLAVRRHR